MKQKDKWKRGLPYVGNKGQNAQKIIDILPEGKRLVDVFGGGGSITLTAASSGKWDDVVYNDRRKTVVGLLHSLLSDNPHVNLMDYTYMDRDQFFDWRDNKPDSIERTLILIVWSFSNNLRDYLYGKSVEKQKLQLTRALFWGDTGTFLDELYEYAKGELSISGKYKAFNKWRRDKMHLSSRYDLLQQLQRLEQLERLQQLELIQQLQRPEQIKYSALDYRSLSIKPSDVVYCDPPYTGTSKDYGGFNDGEFQEWIANCPAKKIYISEYSILPNTEVVAQLGTKHSFTSSGKRPQELLLKYLK